MKLFTAGEIAEYCHISQQAAQFRLERLLCLEKRHQTSLAEKGTGCFYLNPLEKAVYEQFKPYIQKHLL